jgi:hypothetical protein
VANLKDVKNRETVSFPLPDVTFDIFTSSDAGIVEDEICIVVTGQGYYEQQTRQRGKS